MGLAAVVLVTAVGASVTKVPMLFASPTYYGQFSDTGGLMVAVGPQLWPGKFHNVGGPWPRPWPSTRPAPCGWSCRLPRAR